VVLISGGNKGIGRATAEGMAKLRARVLIACRNQQLAMQACQEIRVAVPGAVIDYLLLDFGSLDSVRAFPDAYRKKVNAPIDFLYNNAGVMMPLSTTADCFNSCLQVNYLGHFLLTNLLLQADLLSDHARIINVTSVVHVDGSVRFLDMNYSKSYSSTGAYADTKLYNIMFSNYLNALLKRSSRHFNKCSMALHPGAVETDFILHFIPKWVADLFAPILRMIVIQAKDAAHALVYAALGRDLQGVGGQYLHQCCMWWAAPLSRDKRLCAHLWRCTEEMLRVEFRSKI